MAKSTKPITYVYAVGGHRVEIVRRHVGTAYARNGNVGNPTEYFTWESRLDGEFVTYGEESRAIAYEHARAKALGIPYAYSETRPGPKWNKNVRPYPLVQDEMKVNYQGREASA